MDKISIMSMNCRGLGDLRKRRDVMHYIRRKRFNIVFLQDTHLTEKTVPYFDNLWYGKAYHSCFSSRSRGTSILFNNNVQYSIITEKKSECGNFLMIVCKIHNESYLFVNVYGPNQDNPTFYKNLNDMIEQFDVHHTIVAGDFNFVMIPETDSLNYVNENNVRAKQTFLELSYKYNLIDAWRHMHPTERKYTWLRKTPIKAGRLDMFFVSEDMLNSLSDVEIIPGYRTDHNIITLTIQNEQRRGSGIWKFNTSHLIDEDYIQTVRSCISQTLQQYAVPVYNTLVYEDYTYYEFIQLTISDSLFYETLIMMIRGETVRFSKQKARRARLTEANLITEIAGAETQLLASGLQRDVTHLHILKQNLEEMRRPMIDGLIVRSRVSWHEKGERNTKYFLSLEKRNSNKKNMQYIQDGDNIITNMNEILEKFSHIFQNKYNRNTDIIPDPIFIKNNVTNRLSSKDKIKLDSDITMAELTSALNSMKKGKTPGSNGFPVEFFRCFWLEVGPFLYRAAQTSFSESRGLTSHQEGIITLIPKKGKSPHSYKGWRPITLLNADFKIISTVISKRLQNLMSTLINPAQTAYTSGRFIGENTRLVYDIIHWTKHNNKPGTIVAADFEAAFESIAWDYLRLVINELNFGPNIKQMINHLYLNTENNSRILINGHLGEKINLQRGIRQGDPASGYLFNLAVSILTEQIIKSTRLTGIKITRDHEIRISQYADDTIIFLDGSERSITGSIEELTIFGQQSGLKVNVEKTSCMAIGTLTEDQVNLDHNINFVNELTILGIKIDRDIKNVADRNIELKIPAIKNELEQWNRRCLTPIGRISIVKALLLSKLVHLFIALPTPSTRCTKDIERLLFRFVWGHKNDKIKRTKLVQHHSKDGLKMVQIDSFIKSMKLSWLKRLSTSNANWTVLAAQELPNIWLLLTYGHRKLKMLRNRTANQFYINLLDAFIEFNEQYNTSDEEILTEPIWFSDWTKYETTIVRQWDDRGLRFIADLYNVSTGIIYTKQELETNYGLQNMTILCYTSLVRSLPPNIQKQVDITNIKRPNIPYKIHLVTNNKKFSKYAYKTFVETTTVNNTLSNERLSAKWIIDIGEFIEGSLQNVVRATMSTYLIYLHFRIINRIYATNKYLTTIQVRQSSMCTFCERTTETIIHMFWECSETQIFIKEILSHLRINYATSLNINSTNWIILTDLSNIEVLIVTLSKACIHKSRLKSIKPSLEMMMQSLKLEATKEYNIARENNKMSMFDGKWGELKRLLTLS